MNFKKIAVLCPLMVLAVLAACSKDNKPTDPGDGDGDWQYESSLTYTVDSEPGSTIFDSLTGATLRFPEGGTGSLTIARIIDAPSIPDEGTGLRIDYDGAEPVFLEVDTTADIYASVYGYGKVNGIFDDEIGSGDRWAPLPREEVNGNVVSFILMFPQTLEKPVGPLQRVIGFNNYWVSRITPTSDITEQRTLTGLQIGDFVEQWLNALPGTLRPDVEARVQTTHRYRVEYDGDYYTGFWWRSLRSYGRIVRPTIHLRMPPNAGRIAHETSHYLMHVLTNDNVQSALEGQANLIFDHQIGDNNGRDVVLEEYAYFGQYYFTGWGGGYDLEQPYIVFGNRTPVASDFPSLEGFGAVLLAQLVRTRDTIRDLITGHDVNIPVIGLSYTQVFEIMSGGALGIEQLRNIIEIGVGPANRARLDGILQRIGWSYSIQGTLVDENDAPVPGALVSNLLTIGDITYEGGYSSIPSESDGAFRIVGQVFPGNSTLRVISGTDTTDVDINIAYTNRTNQTVDIGQVTVEGLMARMKRTTRIGGGILCGVPHTWNQCNIDSGSCSSVKDNLSWDFSGGWDEPDVDLTWNTNSFSFQFSGTHPGDIFNSPWSNWDPPMSEWQKEISGTVDKTGKLITATFKVRRTELQGTEVGKVENVEIALHDIVPTTILPSGNSVEVYWELTRDNVLDHLTVVRAESRRDVPYVGTVTRTYVSSDWENGKDCTVYWPLDVVFRISIRP